MEWTNEARELREELFKLDEEIGLHYRHYFKMYEETEPDTIESDLARDMLKGIDTLRKEIHKKLREIKNDDKFIIPTGGDDK